MIREHFDLEFSKGENWQQLLRKEKLTFENSQLKILVLTLILILV